MEDTTGASSAVTMKTIGTSEEEIGGRESSDQTISSTKIEPLASTESFLISEHENHTPKNDQGTDSNQKSKTNSNHNSVISSSSSNNNNNNHNSSSSSSDEKIETNSTTSTVTDELKVKDEAHESIDHFEESAAISTSNGGDDDPSQQQSQETAASSTDPENTTSNSGENPNSPEAVNDGSLSSSTGKAKHQHPIMRKKPLKRSCKQCAAAKVKCSTTKPKCSRCIDRGYECEYFKPDESMAESLAALRLLHPRRRRASNSMHNNKNNNSANPAATTGAANGASTTNTANLSPEEILRESRAFFAKSDVKVNAAVKDPEEKKKKQEARRLKKQKLHRLDPPGNYHPLNPIQHMQLFQHQHQLQMHHQLYPSHNVSQGTSHLHMPPQLPSSFPSHQAAPRIMAPPLQPPYYPISASAAHAARFGLPSSSLLASSLTSHAPSTTYAPYLPKHSTSLPQQPQPFQQSSSPQPQFQQPSYHPQQQQQQQQQQQYQPPQYQQPLQQQQQSPYAQQSLPSQEQQFQQQQSSPPPQQQSQLQQISYLPPPTQQSSQAFLKPYTPPSASPYLSQPTTPIVKSTLQQLSPEEIRFYDSYLKDKLKDNIITALVLLAGASGVQDQEYSIRNEQFLSWLQVSAIGKEQHLRALQVFQSYLPAFQHMAPSFFLENLVCECVGVKEQFSSRITAIKQDINDNSANLPTIRFSSNTRTWDIRLSPEFERLHKGLDKVGSFYNESYLNGFSLLPLNSDLLTFFISPPSELALLCSKISSILRSEYAKTSTAAPELRVPRRVAISFTRNVDFKTLTGTIVPCRGRFVFTNIQDSASSTLPGGQWHIQFVPIGDYDSFS